MVRVCSRNNSPVRLAANIFAVILRQFYYLTSYCQAECAARASGFTQAQSVSLNRKTSRCQESSPGRWYKQWLPSASSSDKDGGEARHNDPARRVVLANAAVAKDTAPSANTSEYHAVPFLQIRVANHDLGSPSLKCTHNGHGSNSSPTRLFSSL